MKTYMIRYSRGVGYPSNHKDAITYYDTLEEAVEEAKFMLQRDFKIVKKQVRLNELLQDEVGITLEIIDLPRQLVVAEIEKGIRNLTLVPSQVEFSRSTPIGEMKIQYVPDGYFDRVLVDEKDGVSVIAYWS